MKDKAVVLQALRLYVKSNVDFVDAYLAARCNDEGCPVYTFDQDHFQRPSTTWLPPQ